MTGNDIFLLSHVAVQVNAEDGNASLHNDWIEKRSRKPFFVNMQLFLVAYRK